MAIDDKTTFEQFCASMEFARLQLADASQAVRNMEAVLAPQTRRRMVAEMDDTALEFTRVQSSLQHLIERSQPGEGQRQGQGPPLQNSGLPR